MLTKQEGEIAVHLARKAIEELEHFLLNKRGVSGTPLAYLIRDNVEPDEDDVPINQLLNPPT